VGYQFDSNFSLLPVRAIVNKQSYANWALAEAAGLAEKTRPGAVMFIGEEVLKEYKNDTNLAKKFYCYERLKKDKLVKGDFGWMYDDDPEEIEKVIRLAEEICKNHRPPTPPPFDHPELDTRIRIYQQYEETLKLGLRCLGHYIKSHQPTNSQKAEKAKEILQEFLDYEFSDVAMHPYNWGIWLIAFQTYFRSVDSSSELSANDKKVLQDRFLRINHSDKMDDFYREWRQNPEFHELDQRIWWLDFTEQEWRTLERLQFHHLPRSG
jgi:hypothetical protein